MKTFDIALKYLEGIDLSHIDIYQHQEEDEAKMLQIYAHLDKYLADPENTVSNDYYRRMTFSEALYHLCDLRQGAKESWWQQACRIVRENQKILMTDYKGFTPGSMYPKVMMDKFIEYCDSRKPCPIFLQPDSELRTEFFMGAFHYVTDKRA